MVDRRALLGLLSGLAGLASGVGAAVLEQPALGVAAAGCCLVTMVAGLLLLNRTQAAERQVAGAAAEGKQLDLPNTAREEATSLVDAETRLPDDRFFDLAVDGRVAAARRHLWPVTIVLLEISAADPRSSRPQADAVSAFADLIHQTLRESDIACRVGPLTFGLVLEDTAEEGGVWTAERLQIALAQDVSKVRRVAAGVASYPTHGLTADEVLARAQAALTRACAAEAGRGLGQVEVAQADLA